MEDTTGELRDRPLSEEPEFVDLVVGRDRDADNRSFGELLERLRWHAHLSRSDAAAKLGLSSEYLRLIEAGRRTPALGQMHNFLAAYGAEGETQKVMPGGDRPDLIVLDPLNGEPVIVEFTSRIREARRTALGGPPEDDETPLDESHRLDEGWTTRRAIELGIAVSLLVRADDATIRRVRQMLEGSSAARAGAAE
ncbi:helix-turn-helix transcriptional regulator [Cellulomonas sp.]|uniref:helix-turn-helix transcriptional regulator n=1 Tax=Cellulomonas sp. TaxID=40001 RepID=UPI003BABC889